MAPGDFFNDTTTTTTTTTTTSSSSTSTTTPAKAAIAPTAPPPTTPQQDETQKPLSHYLTHHPHLTPLDKHILSLPSDTLFTPHSWPNLRALIANNDLHLLTRSPSQTRAYLDWSDGVRARYGSLTAFLLRERLGWEVLPSSSASADGDGAPAPPRFEVKNPEPFADEADYAIRRNDWPYGVEAGIVHLCVWLKTPLAVEEGTGDLTEEARGVVEGFVGRVFRERVGEGERGDKVLWFKNWVALQSVRGVDHVHVLVRGVGEDVLEGWEK